ncbi:MAG: FAD:protein FMN transferase [Endozoicomonas sp.]
MSRSYKRSLLLGAVVLIAAFYVLGTRPRIKHFQGETMGTTFSVSYVSTLFDHSVSDTTRAVNEALEDVNQRMSTYRNDSELMQFNQSPVGQPFKASDELVSLVQRSLEISHMSGGAFDVTVGPLVNLWGFGPRGVDKVTNEISEVDEKAAGPEFVQWMLKNYPADVPPEPEIAAALENVGYQYLETDTVKGTLTRHRNLFVDLSSIAKGHGVDRAARALDDLGIKGYMVEVGGEVKLKGQKPGNQAWRLGIRGPSLDASAPALVVSPSDRALATSGDYLNYFEIDGQKYSHSINPATGRPEMGRLAEVSVITDTVADADAFATMFMVLGDKKGLELANREGIAAFFTYHSGEGFESVSSEAFKPYLLQ